MGLGGEIDSGWMGFTGTTSCSTNGVHAQLVFATTKLRLACAFPHLKQ